MAQRDRLDGAPFRPQHPTRVGDYREQSIEVRGLSLRVRERGPENGPAVVLLHGWLDHRGSFDALAPLLGAGLRTLAIDHRGHGDSSWVGAGGFYHFIEYVADLDGVFDQLGLGLPGADPRGPNGPARIVGHSLGAAVTLVFAAIRSARVSHAVLLDGAPLMTRSTEAPLRLAGYLDDLKKPRTRKTVQDVASAVERMRRAQPLLPAAVAQHLAEGGVGPDPAQGGALAWKWDPLVRAHSPLPFSEGVLQALLPQVTAKVLLLRAQNGILPDEIELKARLGRVAALELESVPGTSHHLHLEQPEAVAKLIRRDWERRP